MSEAHSSCGVCREVGWGRTEAGGGVEEAAGPRPGTQVTRTG